MDVFTPWVENGAEANFKQLSVLDPETILAIVEYLKDALLYETVSVNGKDYLLTHSGFGNFDVKKPLMITSRRSSFGIGSQKDKYYSDIITVFGHTPTFFFGSKYRGKVIFTDTWIDIDTIRHEYAHYMDYMLNGSSSHGLSWKNCCHLVGAFPTRCFSKQRSDWYLQKHENERLLNVKYDEYVIGKKVIHPIFGRGTIVDIIGEGISRIACVSFDNVGIKKLAVSWIDSNCNKL